MLMKSMNAAGDLPAANLAGAEGRGERLALWRVAVEEVQQRDRPIGNDWWDLVWRVADQHYKAWLILGPLERNQVRANLVMPRRYETIEKWYYGRFLGLMPDIARDANQQYRVYGTERCACYIIFRLLKHAQPQILEEQDNVVKMLTSPNPCREPQAALNELRSWLNALTRATEIPPVPRRAKHL